MHLTNCEGLGMGWGWGCSVHIRKGCWRGEWVNVLCDSVKDVLPILLFFVVGVVSCWCIVHSVGCAAIISLEGSSIEGHS